jgi:hypothetical protein
MIHHDLYTQPWHITQTNHPDLPPWEYFHDSFSGGPDDPRAGYEESPEGCIDAVTLLNAGDCETWVYHCNDNDEELISIQKLAPDHYRVVGWESPDDDVGETLFLGTWPQCLLAARKAVLDLTS